jgi:hypothetical protein
MDLLRYIPCFTSMKVISGDLAEWFWLAMQALQQSWFLSQCPQTIASIRSSCAHPLSPVLEHSSTRTESPYLGTGQVLTLTFFLFRYPDWQDAGQSNIQKVRHSSVRMQHSSEGYTVATVSLHRLMVNGLFPCILTIQKRSVNHSEMEHAFVNLCICACVGYAWELNYS